MVDMSHGVSFLQEESGNSENKWMTGAPQTTLQHAAVDSGGGLFHKLEPFLLCTQCSGTLTKFL